MGNNRVVGILGPNQIAYLRKNSKPFRDLYDARQRADEHAQKAREKLEQAS